MSDIKTKIKSTIKTIDKTRVGTQKIKDNLIEVKEKADNINDKQYNSAEEYATQNIKDKTEIIANKNINEFDKQGKKAFVNSKNTIQNEIEKYKIRQEEKQQIKNNIAKSNEIKCLQGNETLQTNKNQIENVADIKSKDKVVKVNSNKRTLSKNMKQINNLSKKAIKTSEKVEKNAEMLARENIKTSQKIMQATKEFTRKAVQNTKNIVKVTKKSIKAIVESSKFLINLIIAGGWISVIIIFLFCIMGGTMALYKANGENNSEKGINNENDLVAIALSQLGNKDGEIYWSWYGFDSRVEWCACFVSWCANQTGKINNGTMPKFSNCNDGIIWFKEKQEWIEPMDIPKVGDIIFFDWNEGGQDGSSDHVGIVEYYDIEKNQVHTIEGNSHNECKRNIYSKDDNQIMGYGRPAN